MCAVDVGIKSRACLLPCYLPPARLPYHDAPQPHPIHHQHVHLYPHPQLKPHQPTNPPSHRIASPYTLYHTHNMTTHHVHQPTTYTTQTRLSPAVQPFPYIPSHAVQPSTVQFRIHSTSPPSPAPPKNPRWGNAGQAACVVVVRRGEGEYHGTAWDGMGHGCGSGA